MNKEASLKRKMNTKGNAERSTSSFHLPIVKSSAELAKKYLIIKQEKINSNQAREGPSNKQNKGKGGNNQPSFVLGSQEQFKLSNFAPGGSASSNTNKVQHPMKKSSNIAVTKGDESRKKKQTVNNTLPVNDYSKEMQQPFKKTVPQDEHSGSKQQQQPMKRAVAEGDVTRKKQQSVKKTLLASDFLKVNTVLANENCKQNQQQQPMEGVVAEEVGSGTMVESARKKTKKSKTVPMCRSTSIDEFLKENGEVGEEEDEEDQSYDEEEYETQVEDGETNAESKKRTRGPTQKLKVHARHIDEREEIDKYIIPAKGRKAVFFRINDSWRHFKRAIKKNCLLKYTTLRDRLKHRPTEVPEAHFKKLLAYWRMGHVQRISEINAANRAKQKYMHRMGPINFARIPAKLNSKKENGDGVSQAEMFIVTRQSRKGKQVDEETQTAIAMLQDSIENKTESEMFKSLFGEEKPGRVRCYGKTMTPSIKKKK